jgi:hypothetical protein
MRARGGRKMRRLFLSLLLAAMSISLVACTNTDLQTISGPVYVKKNGISDAPISPEYKFSSDGFLYNYLDTITELFEESENYRIYTGKGGLIYYYEVVNNTEELIDQGYHGWRGGIELTVIDDNMLELRQSFGGAPPFWQKRFYDVSNSRVSRFFPNPVENHGELIAYFRYTDNSAGYVLVIQNAFDPSIYYKEIERDFSLFVITKPSTAEFLDDGKKLSITYWLEPEDQEITEIIDLFPSCV